MDGRRLRRRLRTVPTHLLLFALVTVLAPVWLVVGLVIDVVRRLVRHRRGMAVRMFAFGWWFLFIEVGGLVALLGHWLAAGFGRDKPRLREGSYRLQEWWARRLFGAVVRIFGLTVTVEGLDQVAPGPVIVMMRHASIVDTLLPNVFVTGKARIRLRYVLKKELLADPLLDIAGNRLINHFVDREGDSTAEVKAVMALADGLTDREGVLIYPEGTRFTVARRDRVLAGLGARDTGLAERARRLQRVLPPRPGGSAGLLETGHDVVIAAHTGLEPLATIPDAWSGRIVGSHLRIRFQRFPGSSIPQTRRGRVEWLFDRWDEVDAWLRGW
ncbi:MAG: lysophospholipid acyltransferase family protein [Acidimicrobiia bacterium]|nr:lysophospholipid acyltransferase family protein [Acidimicrobiia bacterium]